MESISIVAAMFFGEAIKEVGKGCGVTQQQVLQFPTAENPRVSSLAIG
jgi:hypothetical protein